MKNDIKREVDPILVSVVRNRLDHITREMGQTMLRTARSLIFSEARDFVTAIFDRRGNKVAQTSYIPVLVDSTPWAMRAMEERFGGTVQEGDMYLMNDPYQGNGHGPDMNIVKPVFHNGEHVFWSLTKGHLIDIGGRGVVGYDPHAQSVYEEGMHFGPTKMYDAGKRNEDLMEFFFGNLVMRDNVEADMAAMVGAANVGERLLKQLTAKHGIDTLEAVIDEMLRSSEQRMREAIQAIPNGIYYGASIADNDGLTRNPVTYKVKVTVDDDEIEFDLSESDDQVGGFINSPICNTASAVSIALFLCIDPDIPHSDSGTSAPIKVVAREGCVANPQKPAPVVLSTTAGVEAIVEACLHALSDALDGQVPAGWSRQFIPNTAGFNPQTGRLFGELHSISRGGSGATPTADGYDTLGSVVCLGGFRATCPEIFELSTPYRLHEYRYLRDSGGEGENRGGLGIQAEWEVLADGLRSVVWGSGALEESAASGRSGGHAGTPNEIYLLRRSGEEVLKPNTFVEIAKGDRFQVRTGGGGGWGKPSHRDPEAVLADVANDVVSPEKARDVYRVAIRRNLTIDEGATTVLRANR